MAAVASRESVDVTTRSWETNTYSLPPVEFFKAWATPSSTLITSHQHIQQCRASADWTYTGVTTT